MASYGYQSDHVNLIADNLRDRYKSGFPILKELIQNADDAKAKRLVFGMHPGFGDHASHPLLQGPGLWVFNDGEFKKDDERAIRSFGLNSKAGESGAIGKFGLGMKSVFHLCEAFFYVAYDGHKNFDVLLNPWRDPDSEDLFHRAWDNVEPREFEALRSLVASEQLNKGCESWFLMWIPLRRRNHVPQKDGKPYGGIVDKYPGDGGSNEMQFLTDGTLSRKIRSVVPLLRNLVSIELASSVQNLGFKVQIALDDGAHRVDHISAELVSTGGVSDGGAGKDKLRFRVQQKAMPGALPFSQFQKLDAWPKTGRLNSAGIREPVPDKSEAEGAVMVSGAAADGDEAKLVIDWAVFLPMEEGLSYEFRLEKSLQQYRIVLHGQFFVDAGRRGIAGIGHLADPSLSPSVDLDDADLHIGWNQAVAQRVILPQLLPTLAEFAKDLGDGEKEELARAILFARSKSSATGIGRGFWENFRDFVCHEQAWVRMITPEGPKWSYVKVTEASRFLLLPRPPRDDPKRPWKVFPRLKELASHGDLLLDESAPSLMRTHANWDVKTLLQILDGVDKKEICTSTGMSYLVSFMSLEERRYVTGSEVQTKLVTLLREILRTEALQTFRSLRSIFRELVSLVRPEFRFALGTKTPDASTGLDDVTLKILLSAETDKLFVPMDLDPEDKDASKGEPTGDEIRNLLKSIDGEISTCLSTAGHQSSRAIENLLRAAQAVLGLLPEKKDERGQAVRVNRSLKVLTAICARTERVFAVSFDDLQVAHQSRLLFKRGFGHGIAAYPVASALAKLLPLAQIWVVDADVASWVQRGDQNSVPVPSADDSTAAYVALGRIGNSQELGNLSARSNFIRTITPTSVRGTDVVRGMRYVLHGSAVHHDDVDSTLWVNAGRNGGVWVKLKRMVESDSWNVVDTMLAGAIKSDDREILGIREVGADEVIEHMMSSGGIERIDVGQFTDEEIADILLRIADEDLWKAMPVHQDTTGGFGPIDEHCYIDAGGLVNTLFLKDVRLIQFGKNQKLRDRQLQWIPTWSGETTIERALKQSNPEAHWELILDSTAVVPLHLLEKISEFRSVSWLPLANGGSISPEDIIDFDQLADDIDRLASHCGYCYAGILAISKDVQKHPSFSVLRTFFANDKSGLARLGQLMVEAGDHLVGDFSRSDISESLIDQLAALTKLPAWGVVKAAIDALGSDRASDVTEHLVTEIQKPLSVEKLIEILNELSAKGNLKLRDAFNLYLRQLVLFKDELPDSLTRIQLLSCDGHWKSAAALCVGAQGVAKGSVLDAQQARFLESYLTSRSSKFAGFDVVGDVARDEASFAAKDQSQLTLEKYFKPWRELMPSGPVGAFFALMGPSCRGLAEDWLKPHSFEYFSERLSWVEPKSRNSPVWDIQRQEYPKLDALEMLHFLPTISNAKEICAVSLLGEQIRVPVEADVEGLLMGNLTFAGTRGGKSYFQMRLREVNKPEQYDKEVLSNMLKKTCECILREAYNQRDPQIGPLWATLEESNQLELAVARELILDRLPFDLRALKSDKKSPVLTQWMARIKKLEVSRAERKESKLATEQVEKEISEAKTELAKLLTSHSEIQGVVLDGIRKRVKQNQYKVSSIAFELLQNADDAVKELQLLAEGDLTQDHRADHIDRFVMETDGDTVRFIHWGRPINYMGHGSARNESHGEDLQRMLILAASDKEETTGLTGKFGLGFKSVLLATDAPCVLSGDLRTKIVGGCLPTPWVNAGEATKSLERHRLPHAPGLRGTVVEFNVNDPEKRAQVLDRFSALAGLQCVFSKKIRSIQVNETIHQWRPTYLTDDLRSIEIGTVQMPSKGGHAISRLLNFRMGDGCFSLRVGSRGFVRFQSDVEHFIPGIWVTAPTREPTAIGLILNSQFELDTGRGGLPSGLESAESNLATAERLGSIAAALVSQAITWTRGNWELAKVQFKLVKDVTASEFWASFWEQIPVLKSDIGESDRLLSQFGSKLFERFLAVVGELPNGLSAHRSAFVSPSKVCLAFNSRWEKLYEPLIKWPEFVERFPVSGWVSVAVAGQLKSIQTNAETDVSEMSVQCLLDFLPIKGCSAVLINTLGQLLCDPSLEENECIKEKMCSILLQAKDGSWHLGCQLINADVEAGNQFLKFAPANAILHPSYQGLGLKLIQDYAGFVRPQGGVVAKWILEARPDPHAARIAALKCLLGSPDIRHWVNVGITGSWIEALAPSSPYLLGFSIPEKNLLLVMFNAAPVWDVADIEEPSSELLTGPEALEAIRDWWQENSATQLEKFYREFWPASVLRKFDSIYEDRASWMTLFAIGLMQRQGRVRPQQNRGFIDFMHSKGWWHTFSMTNPRQDGAAWLGVLNAYGEHQIEVEQYSLWMDNFPRLYRMARWFDEYTHAFQSLDNRARSETAGLLAISADPVLSGSGIYAPAMRNSLKLGQHVVIRELLRCHVLSSEAAKAMAFKPGDAVKQMLSGIGFEYLAGEGVTSEQIYDELCNCLGEDATFGGAYDIPLLILAADTALQRQILGNSVTYEDGIENE